jgi:hypothetical protein
LELGLVPASSLQTAFDLLGEILRNNLVSLEIFELLLEKQDQYDKFMQIVLKNLVDSNVFLRSLFISMEYFDRHATSDDGAVLSPQIDSSLSVDHNSYDSLICSSQYQTVTEVQYSNNGINPFLSQFTNGGFSHHLAHNNYHHMLQSPAYLSHSWQQFAPEPLITLYSPDLSLKPKLIKEGSAFQRSHQRNTKVSTVENKFGNVKKGVVKDDHIIPDDLEKDILNKINQYNLNITNHSNSSSSMTMESTVSQNTNSGNPIPSPYSTYHQPNAMMDEEPSSFYTPPEFPKYGNKSNANAMDIETVPSYYRRSTLNNDSTIHSNVTPCVPDRSEIAMFLSIQDQQNGQVNSLKISTEDSLIGTSQTPTGMKSTQLIASQSPTRNSNPYIYPTNRSKMISSPTNLKKFHTNDGIWSVPKSLQRLALFLHKNHDFILFKLMTLATIYSINHENICCLNTALLVLIHSYQRNQLGVVLDRFLCDI